MELERLIKVVWVKRSSKYFIEVIEESQENKEIL